MQGWSVNFITGAPKDTPASTAMTPATSNSGVPTVVIDSGNRAWNIFALWWSKIVSFASHNTLTSCSVCGLLLLFSPMAEL